LQRAWDEGQVAIGRDAIAFASFAGGVGALLLAGQAFSQSIAELLTTTLRSLPEGGAGALQAGIARPIFLAFSVTAASCIAGCAAAVTQTQGYVWPHLAMPDFSRLFQGARLARLFQRDMFIDLGLALVKVVAVALVIWHAVRGDFMALGRLLLAPATSQLTAVFAPLTRSVSAIVVTVGILAGVDLAITRLRFASKMKMTREEAKREYREEEGDPLLRSRRRRRQRELSKGRARVEVPRADALLVNPTHIAIAIRYRKAEGKAPRVIAKGKGVLAEHMRELARENGIPIVEDVPLARLLWKRVKVGREVPVETYKAVAAILAFVYRLTGKAMGAAA
jgi:flagellar biosynthesis protein FlhB